MTNRQLNFNKGFTFKKYTPEEVSHFDRVFDVFKDLLTHTSGDIEEAFEWLEMLDKEYDIFAGLKGKLTNNVSYNVKGSYVNERNKALFKSNSYNENIGNEDYAFGNSMQVVYDDMRTLNFYGELKADFSENITFGINGSFSSFTTDFQSEAWNLPAVKINSNVDFNITKKWFAGANVFYVGERKDLKWNTSMNLIDLSPITLKSYFDVNASLGYNYSERLTGFIRANNITNNGYQKWLNYPVQGFQIILGANYKFDF